MSSQLVRISCSSQAKLDIAGIPAPAGTFKSGQVRKVLNNYKEYASFVYTDSHGDKADTIIFKEMGMDVTWEVIRELS